MTTPVRTPQQIGRALRTARRAQKLTQSDLADRSGQRQELISKLESGSPGTSIQAVCALLAALDLELTVRPRSTGTPDIEEIF